MPLIHFLTKRFIIDCINEYKIAVVKHYDSLVTFDQFLWQILDHNYKPINHSEGQLIRKHKI